jgi:TonB family protein
MTLDFPTEVDVRGMKLIRELRKKDSVSNQAQIVTGSIEPMSVSLRPTILYREKAQYTQEAKDNKIEGTVILGVVFGVDGQLGEIRVIKGLPHGLTEKAIEATKKIRFEPAVKDGQPVSVRGSIEFSFNLYNDSIQAMTSSLRPTILYKEKAQYTQEAKDNKVAGTVVLGVVFGVDGQIGEIKVIHGLPYGLTENAIEAAKKIRFNPAVKDSQPVSVRGNLEYTFNLDN